MTTHILVRFTVNPANLTGGELSSSVMRDIHARFFDVPAGVWCVLDVGAARSVDHRLLAELARRPCARTLRVEARDYRVALEGAGALAGFVMAGVQ